jgi:hypothetical protein
MSELRDLAGPFADCREGFRRVEAAPVVEP